MAGVSAGDWSSGVFQVLKGEGVRQVAYVPDAGHTGLIRRCRSDRSMTAIPLTTEEEGVALLSGAWLGGEAGVLLMQSSGVGNIVNMLSVAHECRFPLLILVTMRGEWGEFNPWQMPMGQATQAVLDAAGVIVQRADSPDRVAETVKSAAAMAFDGGRMVAVLIGQRLVGFKDWSR